MTTTTVAAGETRDDALKIKGADELRVLGDFIVGDDDPTVLFSDAVNGARIVNEGSLLNEAEDGRAIRIGKAVGSEFTATIENSGRIASENDVVQIQNEITSGSLTILNAATGRIEAGSGQGLDLASGAGAFQTFVTNAGLIDSDENDGLRFGGRSALTNSGVVAGGSDDGHQSKADGVQFESGAIGRVTNTASGVISGDRHGVNADEDTTVTVVNSGEIVGRNGSGVGSDGTATVYNYGDIVGRFSDLEGTDVNGSTVGAEDGGGPDGVNDGDGDGVDVDFRAVIHNHGSIRGEGSGGTGSDGLPNTSEGIAAGGGVIRNFRGAEIVGEDIGVLIDDSSQGEASYATYVSNLGTIRGESSYAIKLVSAQGDTIANGGLIAGGDGVAILFGSGDDTLALRRGSVIDGLSLGGDGADTLSYAGFRGSVYVNLHTGAATGTGGVRAFENVTGGAGHDRITGDASVNAIHGGGGRDLINGGAGDDILDGGVGADRIIGGSGADRLTGGLGADLFSYAAISDSAAAAHDVITDFSTSEGDRIRLSYLDADVTATGRQSFVWVEGFTGAAGQLYAASSGGSTTLFGDVDGDRVADFVIELHNVASVSAGDFLL
ncbi:M10 family metallopeptidase C-terminal domain-containing protein [Methylopila musalis]|uniref:M10 family metallopeptidase C-terminal domain-containing protein n=1 Tax=Methylopila musalis TaxID=1134781 RepID=A0ABW3ZB45_9HYPH